MFRFGGSGSVVFLDVVGEPLDGGGPVGEAAERCRTQVAEDIRWAR